MRIRSTFLLAPWELCTIGVLVGFVMVEANFGAVWIAASSARKAHVFSSLLMPALLVMLLPPAMHVLQHSATRPFRARFMTQAGLAIGFASLAQMRIPGLFSDCYAHHNPAAGAGTNLVQNATTGILFYGTAAGIVRALQWYRSTHFAESHLLAMEAAALEKMRNEVAFALRPRAILEVLKLARADLPDHPAEAEHRLRRLAHHERVLLQARGPQAPVDNPFPVPPLPRVAIRGSGYTWLVLFLAIGCLVDIALGDAHDRMFVAGRLIMFACWVVAAPPLVAIASWIIGRPLGIAIGLLALVSSAAALAVACASAFGAALLHPVAPGLAHYGRLFTYLSTRAALISCGITFISFAFALGRRLLRAEARMARMINDTTLAELVEFETNMQPHFLFNGLNSLIALVHEDPNAAAVMCDRFSGLFARSIASAGTHQWTLSEELTLLDDYLSVQKVRFGERLDVTFEIEPGLERVLLPRLLLQPVLENAVKHGVARRREPTSIRVTAARRSATLLLDVTSDMAPGPIRQFRPSPRGRGLTFVRERAVSFGGRVRVATSRRGQFVVRCEIPIRV